MTVVPDPTALRNILIVDAFVVDDMNDNDHDKYNVSGGSGAEIFACLVAVLCSSPSLSTLGGGVGGGGRGVSKDLIEMEISIDPRGGVLRA